MRVGLPAQTASPAASRPEREFLATLRLKSEYVNDGGGFRGVEDVVLVTAPDRWVAVDRALGTRNIPSSWYVFSLYEDEDDVAGCTTERSIA